MQWKLCLNSRTYFGIVQVDIEATGTGKFVEEALEGEREKERDTLKRLVEENVRLERQLTKTQEQLR